MVLNSVLDSISFFKSFIFSPEIKISNGLRNIHSRDENLKFSSVFDKIQSRMVVFCIHLKAKNFF